MLSARGRDMEDCCLCLRLPTLPFEQNECSTKEPSSPDSGFSSDDSSSSSPLMRPKSDRLRSALRRLPSDCRKKVRFGDAVVVHMKSDDENIESSSRPAFIFTPPKRGVAFPNFSFRTESEHWNRARSGGICVSAIRHCGMSIFLQVAIHNRAYNKDVFVRWSTNNWQESSDQSAVYSHTATPDTDIDIFTTTLPLKNENIDLCVCYRVEGEEYWDNNNGSNYNVQLRV